VYFTRHGVKGNARIAAVATRKYEQRLRAEAAEQTRRSILDAVYDHLRRAPSTPVSVEQVARSARVSRSTVYLIFGSRAGLFDALTTDLWWHRSGFRQVVEAVEHPDAREHMRGGIGAGVRVFAAHRDVFRALFSMAQLDPDAVGGAIARIEENRAGGMAHLGRRLAEQEVLRPDVTVEDAADLLWLLTSFDGFDQLYSGRGLAVDDVVRALITTAERCLCR
jgi:AcrR family transcriptional regulator